MRGLFDWLRKRPAEPAGLGAWRDAWVAAVRHPEPEAAARLRASLDAAGLPEEEIEIEREMLEGLEALCELRSRADAGRLPVLETGHRAAAGAACHFSAPVSMPDEPGQPSGRLLLTDNRAVFAGPGNAHAAWHIVGRALQAERDLVLVLRGRDRAYRFRCNSYADALTAAEIAQRLLPK